MSTDTFDYTIAYAVIFCVGGIIVVSLYSFLYSCPGPNALSRDETWGYIGRYGEGWKLAWKVFTLFTAAAVCTLFIWLSFISENDDKNEHTALAGTIVFMLGAIVWPIGVLRGSMRLAQAGVLTAAVGSIILLIYVLALADEVPVWALIAAIWTAFHHCVIDGLWATLSPKGTAMLVEKMLQ